MQAGQSPSSPPARSSRTSRLVENMRRVVAHERTRERRRAVLLGVMVLLIAALDGLLFYLLTSARTL
jgi:hypothetical protein